LIEFKSRVEDVLEAKELFFDPTPGFGRYRMFLYHAIVHPAKMNTRLLEFLIKKFTNKGDVVLDPMAGTGSTGVVAALHGRHAVCVELEKTFWQWMEWAREKVERLRSSTPKGKIVNICGDARKLSKLLQGEMDVIVTSPPYADGFKHNPQDKEKRLKKLIEVDRRAVLKGRKWAFTSLEALKRRLAMQDEGYGASRENIGNLPLGNIDAVITSPPYEGSCLSGGDSEKRRERLEKAGYDPEEYLGGKARNAVLKHYSEVDTIITSPPYEGSFEGGSRHTGGILEREKGKHDTMIKIGEGVKYSDSKENIGNLKRETYLQAMFQVYTEMWKVLKTGGKAIIVIKPFIRNKRVVDLPWHTYLLLKKIGFKLVNLYKLRLKQQSFWRILYHKKYPEVPCLAHEYVLVMEKPSIIGSRGG